MGSGKHDAVARPDHYNWHPAIECIRVTQEFNFNLGNVVKYVWRAGRKSTSAIEDLRKARQYLDFEIARLGDAPCHVRAEKVTAGWVHEFYRCGMEQTHVAHTVEPMDIGIRRCITWCDGYL